MQIRFSHSHIKKLRALGIAAISSVLLLLSACGQAPIKTETQTTSSRELPVQDDNKDPEKLLQQARSSTNPSVSSQLLLKASQAYWTQGLSSQAKATLQEIQPQFLSPESTLQFWQLTFDISMLELDLVTLADATQQLRTLNAFSGSIDQQLAIFAKLESAYQLMDQPAEAALIMIEQYRMLPDDLTSEDLLARNERIWQYLKSSSPDELGNLSSSIALDELQGWLSLSQAIQFQRNSLKQQHSSLIEWLEQWPLHSAAAALPKELEILQRLPSSKAQEIVIALPFTGAFSGVSQAISDGFMAGYYGANDFSNDLSVRFYDTNKHNFFDLYDQNLSNKSVIIGPLEKDTLRQLSQRESVPVQTIALNQVATDIPTLNLFQFSLRPEQESAQIVRQLNLENKRRIAILAPENKWGKRIETELTRAIQQNGILTSKAVYSTQKTLAGAVAKLLATDASKKRARLVQDIAGLRLETTPRRRQDLDAIVMIAKPEIARQLKPLLAFHYASDVPVYASSQINEANDQADNRDLNGINFLDMPWVLNDDSNVRKQIRQSLGNNAVRYDRFYAMGADAYSLAPRIELLTQVDNSYIDGHTGRLFIDDLNVVERELTWAKFRGGRVVTQP